MITFQDFQEKNKYEMSLIKTLEQIEKHILEKENVKYDSEISLIFVDNKEIQRINKENRNIDKITDVLSFPTLSYRDGNTYSEEYENKKHDLWDFNEGNLVLGDVVISLEKAKEQSENYGHSFEREVCYLFTHSILHLLGYDHMEEKEIELMRKKEEEYLEKFEIRR